MAEHRLPAGRACIDWLIELGSALGYHALPEWEIPDPEGPVYADVAWLRRPHDAVPLFLFEVESVPGQGIAENALKTLTVPTVHAAKPLFFFHLVLTGGGSRPGRAARAFDDRNYAVYRLATDGAGNHLLADILREHARLQDETDVVALWQAMASAGAPPHSRGEFFATATRCLPKAAWTRDLAAIAVSETNAQLLLAQMLLPCIDHRPPPGARYDTYWGTSWSQPLQLGVIAGLLPEHAPACLEALQAWQGTVERGETMIGPWFGRDPDYDTFVLGQAPLLWALLATLLESELTAAAWIAEQLRTIIECEHLQRSELAASAVWGLHLATAYDLPELWDAAANALNARGGIAEDALLTPPVALLERDDLEGRGELEYRLARQAAPVTRQRFERLARELRRRTPDTDPIALALRLLVLDLPGDNLEQDLLVTLHRSRSLA